MQCPHFLCFFHLQVAAKHKTEPILQILQHILMQLLEMMQLKRKLEPHPAGVVSVAAWENAQPFFVTVKTEVGTVDRK